MSKKKSSDKKSTRKAMLIGAGIGILVMPVFFFLVSLGRELTSESLIWLCVNGTCSGVIVGGGIGYLLMENDIRFW